MTPYHINVDTNFEKRAIDGLYKNHFLSGLMKQKT